MKLRWFQTYDKYGKDSEPILQWWDEEKKIWEDVMFIRCSEIEEHQFLHDENQY